MLITILANPEKERLSADALHLIAASLSMQGIAVQKTRWLKAGEACEYHVIPNAQAEGSKDSSHTLGMTINQILRGKPYDAILQPYPKPHYKLLITDMDSTMIEQECIDELADFVGKKAEVSAITERAMNGELDFAQALNQRVALLAGLPEAMLQRCFDERITLMPGAKALVSHMKQQGAHTVLVSGGFTFFTSRVRTRLGMDEDFSNSLDILYPSPLPEGGILSGKVIPPILGKEAKLETLHAQCAKLGIPPEEVLAIGDGANDLPMLLAAGLGVAYRAKPTVRAQAKNQLNHTDLSSIMFL